MAAASLFLISGIVTAQDYLREHAGPQPALSPPILNGAHGSVNGSHGSDAQWQHGHDGPEVVSDLHSDHGGHHAVESADDGAHAGCKCGTKHCHGVCLDPGRPAKPKHEKPGDVDRGDCPPKRYLIPDCKRAGNPHCVAPWAKCSVDDKYSSWFVGGGAAFFRGRCRKPSEGTWGLDYNGLFGHANVWLNYTRGRNQGGEGAYKTDGEPAFVSKAHSLLGLGH